MFGGGGIGAILGDIIGGVGGFLVGGPFGAAIGAGLGGAAGNALAGGKGIGNDLMAGISGAGAAFGIGSIAEGLGLSSFAGSFGGAEAGAEGIGAGAEGIGGGSDFVPGFAEAADAPAAVGGPAELAGAPAAGGAGAVTPAATGGMSLPTDLTSLAEQEAAAAGGAGDTAAAAGANMPIPPIPPGGAAGATGGGGFMNAVSGMMPSSRNILPIVSGGLLARNLLSGQGNIPGMSELSAQAAGLAKQSQTLSAYLTNGTLPPGAQASIDQATSSAIAAVKGKFASMGQTGSTMEMQQIAAIQQNAAAQGGQLAAKLLDSGINLAGISDNIYQFLVGANQKQSDQTGQAITNFSAAMAGGFPTGNGGFIMPGSRAA